MSIATVIDVGRLDAGWILAPERYDPRRRRARDAGPCVGDFVQARRDTIAANADASRRYLVFDTGDAKDSVLAGRKPPANQTPRRIVPLVFLLAPRLILVFVVFVVVLFLAGAVESIGDIVVRAAVHAVETKIAGGGVCHVLPS